jgi:hypothetical protein
MKFLRLVITFVLAFYFVTFGCNHFYLFAQTPDSKPKQSKEKNKSKELPPIEVKTNLLVTNEKNKPIDTIKQEDVKIFEDGVEQKITYFARKDHILNLGLVIDNSGLHYSFRRLRQYKSFDRLDR